MASGWAYEPGSGPVLMQAVLNNEILGEAVAEADRPDLARVGIGDGRCGFTIDFHRVIDAAYLPFVVVRPEGGDVELPRWSAAGFAEFFRALYQAYPLAGRSRSVFGGLWTDRTDAAAMLRGKLAVGQIDETSADVVGELIKHGVALLAGGERVSTRALREATAAEAAALLLAGARVQALLHAVLEDVPVVFRAGAVAPGANGFVQPSMESGLPLPNECLAVVAPTGGEPVEIDIVRASHDFPEFTRDGFSRWVDARAASGLEALLAEHGMLDRLEVKPGVLALIGPGLLYRLVADAETRAVKLLLTAARAVPVSMAAKARSGGGIRVWV
jgi:hypothetical protein